VPGALRLVTLPLAPAGPASPARSYSPSRAYHGRHSPAGIPTPRAGTLGGRATVLASIGALRALSVLSVLLGASDDLISRRPVQRLALMAQDFSRVRNLLGCPQRPGMTYRGTVTSVFLHPDMHSRRGVPRLSRAGQGQAIRQAASRCTRYADGLFIRSDR
jgi:hypothetical protein